MKLEQDLFISKSFQMINRSPKKKKKKNQHLERNEHPAVQTSGQQ